MRLRINGAWKECPESENLEDFLIQNGYEKSKIAVELNTKIIPKAGYQTQKIHENDVLEIVSFVGGG